MSDFKMCDKCSAQYTDVPDRRFHAQPVACLDCGPKIWLSDNKANTLETKSDQAIAETVRLLRDGKIVAIKGIGGFHLAVDALNEKAVKRLRQRKKRDHKPFALMTNSLDNIRKYAKLSSEAESILNSCESPIVLLPKKQNSKIAPSVAEGVNAFGFMLCYAPLHWLLFAQGLEVLVMTSGNISDEPLICKNQEALTHLADVADAFLIHDREIYRQVDDSIVHFVDNQPALLRRARGYVPTPILSDQTSEMDIFAAGADMKNTFCFAKQNQLIPSEHIGDLEDAKVYHHYIDSIEHLRSLFEVEPKIVACDLHPGYLSTQYALSIPDVKTIQIQHHWAHAASVLAEHNLTGPAIALICDGTGYGTDAAIWGCECLIASLDNFKRFGHLSYYPLAGADKAGKEAIRPILGLLKQTYKNDFDLNDFAWLLDPIEPDSNKQKIILEQLNKSVNTVQTSSLGRVFDAVAAILDLGSYNNFEAQLPMALEAIADQTVDDGYDFELIESDNGPVQFDLALMIKQLITDLQAKTQAPVIAAKFHNCLAAALTEMAGKARKKTSIRTVLLSGGVFCNRYLANRLITLLNKNDFSVLLNREVPPNDGGISLGQAAIAARLANGP
ncbi:MAG: carbamoyltransferase HypF [Planctomycetota bacterium]|jgi:hydrogenase maturation protein HypF